MTHVACRLTAKNGTEISSGTLRSAVEYGRAFLPLLSLTQQGRVYVAWLQMLRSIVDVNLPKFLAHDVPLFHGIINDLFPGVNLPRVEHTQFLEAVEKICRQNNLQNVPFFTEKLVQMYEMMLVRHGYVYA